MDLTVIAIFFNNRREAPRTLYTLSKKYQLSADDINLRVLAIDSNSPEPLDPDMVESIGPEFEYHFVPTSYPTPLDALSFGLAQVSSKYVMVLIDGAHMLTPRIYLHAKNIFKGNENAVVTTPNFHLGKYHQNESMLEGYNQAEEDLLLETVDWKNDGYSLFSISSYTQEFYGFFNYFSESNCFAVKTDILKELHPYDDPYRTKGGGFVNLEVFRRLLLAEQTTHFSLIGEGTFHQFHGGSSTNISRHEHPVIEYRKEYVQLYGKHFLINEHYPVFYGQYQKTIDHLRPVQPFRYFEYVANEVGKRSFQDAENLLLAGTKKFPYNLQLKQAQAKLYMQENKFDLAHKALDEAIEIDSSAFALYNLKARCFYLEQEYEKSIQCFDTAMIYDPMNIIAIIQVAIIHLEQNDIPAYKNRIPEILSTQKKSRHIHPIVSLITAQIKYKQYEDVEQFIIEGKKLDAYNLHFNFITYKYYEAVNNSEQAQLHYNRVFKILERGSVDDVNENFIFNFCNSLLSSKRFEDVITLVNKYEKTNQAGIKTRFLLAKANSDLGRKKEAIQIYESVYDQLNKKQILSERIHERYILTNIQIGDYRKAYELIKEYQIFYKKSPNDLINLLSRKLKLIEKDDLNQLLSTFSFYDGLHSIHFNKHIHTNSSIQDLENAYKIHQKEAAVFYNKIKRNSSHEVSAPYDCIHHVHMQKTGGSTIRRILIEYAINSGIVIDQIYAPGELGLHKSKNISLLSEQERIGLRAKRWKIIADHSELFFEKKYAFDQIKNPFRFTIMREPLTWFSSIFNSFVSTDRNSSCFNKKLEQVDLTELQPVLEQYQNFQTRFLSGEPWFFYNKTALTQHHLDLAIKNLGEFQFVGIFESFEDSVNELTNHLPDWIKAHNIGIPHLNQKRYTNKMDDDIQQEILKYFKLDIVLYAEAQRLFEQQ